MASMYPLPLYFPRGTNAAPLGNMYPLPSYHDKDAGSPAASTASFDPVQQLEADQLALIKLLKEFNVRLDGKLASAPKAPKAAATPTPSVGTDAKVSKKDKKEKSGKGEAPTQKGTRAPPKAAAAAAAPWKVTEEKAPAEVNNGGTASARPALADFPINKLTKATLVVTVADFLWVEKMAKIGGIRGFAFTGGMLNAATPVNGSIHVEIKNAVTLTVDGVSVSGRTTVAKLLAAYLGLFSFEPTRAVQATHVHRWLERADEVVASKKDPKVVDAMIRDASKFLARFDSLSSQPALSVADIVVRSMLPENTNFPNNVECWAKRLDALL